MIARDRDDALAEAFLLAKKFHVPYVIDYHANKWVVYSYDDFAQIIRSGYSPQTRYVLPHGEVTKLS